MAKARKAIGVWSWRTWRSRLLAGCLVLAGGVSSALGAAPTVAQMLTYNPRQKEVVCSTPTTEAQANCKVELVKGAQGKGSGWLLRDAQNQPVRLYFDTNGDNKIDVYSYYKEGVEVYRENDTNFDGKVDQYRWLNSGGMKWGLDLDADGTIDTWKAISPEEVSQEVLLALVNKDLRRLQALMITEEDIKTLGLPADQVTRLGEIKKNAPTKFQETLTKLTSLGPKATWIHLETPAPECQPADQIGSKFDVIKYPRGTVLFDVGGKNDWLQTGELIQVGMAWRLVDAPSAGAVPTVASDNPMAPGSIDVDNPEVVKLIEALSKVDQEIQAAGQEPATLVRLHLQRADVLEKVVGVVDARKRDPWIRQVADSLSTAAQTGPGGDKTAQTRLNSLVQQLSTKMPGSNLAAYVTYREMQADYTVKVTGSDKFEEVQKAWLEKLSTFVQNYPNAEDTPEVLLQAGMVSEILTKDIEAKNWYKQLATKFPGKIQATKAEGAIRRLELEGKELKLAAPTLKDPAVAFDVDQMRGKVAIVYYWASWNSQSVTDFTRLKAMLDTHGAKGVDLVCVNLDNSADDARKFLEKNPAPGTHVHQAGGQESKLATDYGIMGLPNVFLIGKDGKVVNNHAQIATLEDELKKLLK